MTEKKEKLEQDIIGAILFRPEQIHAVTRVLDDDCFSVPFYRKVFRAMRDCLEKGYEINTVNISQVGKLTSSEEVSLVDIPQDPGDLSLLARKLTEYVIKEKCMGLKHNISEDKDAFELVDEMRQVMNEVASLIGRHNRRDKQDILQSYKDYLQSNAEDGVKRLPTGFPTLDKMLAGGFALGDISFIGGQPGSGKTSLVLCEALSAARSGVKTALIEGEMTEAQILERMNGIATGESIDQIRKGNDYEKLSNQFVSELSDLPFELIPCYERTIETLTDRVREAVHKGCRLIFVDYLQVFTQKGKAEDEYSQIKKVSETLRQLALQNDVHICVVSSLNRNEAGQKKLTLNSYYGSSQLGHDCAVGLLLSGEQNDEQELSTRERKVTLHVVKNREGARGDINLKFYLASQQMEEVVEQPSEIAASEFEVEGQ
jgi:replicative DNA helicase